MIIKILFSGIKDISKLYKDEHVKEDSPFGGESPVTEHIYLGKEYCEPILNSVCESIKEVQNISYQESFGRIANEVFVLQASDVSYTVNCTIDTYKGETARLTISIDSDNQNNGGSTKNVTGDLNTEVHYDMVLESLKIKIKDSFLPDWNSCVWYKDEQAEMLSSLLYPYIFDTENKIRGFVDKVLIWKLGYNWLDSPGLEKYHDSCMERAKDFRSNVPSFTDVDDALISATLEMLFDIIKNGKVYESEFKLNRLAYDQLISLADKGKGDIAGYLRKHRTVKVDLWVDIFEKYFGCPSTSPVGTVKQNPQQIITDFIKNRNHVAHNKPLTFQAYKKIEQNIKDMRSVISHADSAFEDSIPSDELYLTWDAEQETQEEAREQEEYEKNYLRDRISGETGVDILLHDEIFDLLLEQAQLLYTTIHDQYYFDEQYDISNEYALEDKIGWQLLCKISCKACEEYYIEIFVDFTIDDDMDADSELNLRYVVHENEKAVLSDQVLGVVASIHYHNGSGTESLEDGSIYLDSESSLNTSEQDDFLEGLDESLKNLNPYVKELQDNEYEIVKEGAESPVADFPCWECGKYGVSIRQEFFKFGHCCYCGSDNEVKKCQRCGSYFGGDDGRDGFCEYCLGKIEQD